MKDATTAMPPSSGAAFGSQAMGNIAPTGGASVPVALDLPQARGFSPAAALQYSSAGGNGAFGVGWTLSLQSVSRLSSRGVPAYGTESFFDPDTKQPLVPDQFLDPDSGEILVPLRNNAGLPQTRTVKSLSDLTFAQPYVAHRFVCSVGHNGRKIEHWVSSTDPSDSFWVVFRVDGGFDCYGRTQSARVFDPDNPTRVAEWLIEESVSHQGDHIYYAYRAEDDAGLDKSVERGRDHRAKRYIDKICYGSLRARQTPYILAAEPMPSRWHFEVQFDYGERTDVDSQAPRYAVEPGSRWRNRPDPFSNYSYGFEIRTHRLCRQILVFHYFPAVGEAPGLGDEPVIAKRFILQYAESPLGCRLASAKEIRYDEHGHAGALPSTEFLYEAPQESSAFAAYNVGENRLQRSSLQFMDLYGDGQAGILSQDLSGRHFYQEPIKADGKGVAGITYGPAELVPNPPIREFQSKFSDLTGNGLPHSISVSADNKMGFSVLSPDRKWSAFQAFSATVPSAFSSQTSRMMNIRGTGLEDLIEVDGQTITIYPSLRQRGFGNGVKIPLPQRVDSLSSSELVKVDVIDLLGAGLPQLVWVKQKTITCLPSLGRGAFGSLLTFAWELGEDKFNAARVYFASVLGTGVADLCYVGETYVKVFRNESGNRFVLHSAIPLPPGTRFNPDNPEVAINFADVTGTGCSSIVFSQLGTKENHYVYHFASRGRPGLLALVDNNLGFYHEFEYKASSRDWLDEKAERQKAGRPLLLSKMPFSMPVVYRHTTVDEINKCKVVQRYTYRHGYYDGLLREFRGFGSVFHLDSEAPDSGNADTAPGLFKTWYHLGRIGDEQAFRDEYFGGDPHFKSGLGPTPSLDFRSGIDRPLTPDQIKETGIEAEVARSLKGSVLRIEKFGLDASALQDTPHSVFEFRYKVRILQPGKDGMPTQMLPLRYESFSLDYHRNATDPRCSHDVELHADEYGKSLLSANIQYPRRRDAQALPGTEQFWNLSQDSEQQKLRVQVARCELEYRDHDRPTGNQYIGLPKKLRVDAYVKNDAAFKLISGELLEKMLESEETIKLAWPDGHELISMREFFYVEDAGRLMSEHSEQAVLPDETVQRMADKSRHKEVFSDEHLGELGYSVKPGFLGAQGAAEAKAYFIGRDYRRYSEHKPTGFLVQDFEAPYMVARGKQAVKAMHFEYDPYAMLCVSITDDFGMRGSYRYNYLTLSASYEKDANENVMETAFDAWGAVKATTMYREAEGHDGFSPMAEYDMSVTFEDALANPAKLLQGCAAASHVAHFGWMGRIPSDTSTSDRSELQAKNFVTSDGLVTALGRHALRQETGQTLLSTGEKDILKRALAARTPITQLTVMASHTPELQRLANPDYQFKFSLIYRDGLDRIVQSRSPVNYAKLPPRLAQPEPDAWLVSQQCEYNNKGGVRRAFREYYSDHGHYTDSVEPQAAEIYTTYIYNAFNELEVVENANGEKGQSKHYGWFTVQEDRNDTAHAA